MTEELASFKTENSDISRDVTEELASLKTENSDIVQGSVNLVTQKNWKDICQQVIYIMVSQRKAKVYS